MRPGLVLILFLAFLSPIRAEKPETGRVSGTVVDQSSGHPVEYAAIVLKDAGGQVLQRTATNTQGAFEFEAVPFGRYRIAYSHVGGEPNETPPFDLSAQHRDIGTGGLALRSDALTMQRVEVTARRDAFYSSIDRKTYNVGKDLTSVSGSASDLLQNIPSVDVDVDGNVSLRGNDNVLILVDGKPSTLMSTTNRPDVLAQMPADSIERIEVITNPSAKYKPDGTAGIINLVMKRQHRAGVSATARVSVGNDSRSNAALSANYNPGKYNLFASVSVRQDDRNRTSIDDRRHLDAATNTLVATHQNSFEHMRPLSRLFQSGFDYHLSDDDKVGLSANYNLRSFYRDGTINNQSRAASGALTMDYDRARADNEWQKTTEVVANYAHNFAEEGHELNVELKRDRHWEQENNHYTNTYVLPAAASSLDYTLIKPTETGTELTADYTRPFADDGKLEAGFTGELNRNDMDYRGGFFDVVTGAWRTDATTTNRFIYDDRINAVYATFGRPIGRFGFLAGLRLESTVVHSDQVTTRVTDRMDYNRLHPTLHLNYNLTDTRQLQLNYSHRIHRPESDDLNPFPEYQDPYNLRAGNPRLRPEETHSIEAGYQYRKDDTTYLVAGYFRDTYHAFTTVTRYIDTVTLLTTHENLATNRSGGVELVATTTLGGHLSVNTSANAYYSEIDASNLGLPGTRSTVAWSGKANLTWHASKSDSVQVDASYAARRLTAQGYRLPTAVANLGWRHEFKDRRFAFTTTISDVFNSLKERTVIDTPTLHDDTTRRRSSRIIYAGLIYTFGKPPKKPKDDLQFDNSL